MSKDKEKGSKVLGNMVLAQNRRQENDSLQENRIYSFDSQRNISGKTEVKQMMNKPVLHKSQKSNDTKHNEFPKKAKPARDSMSLKKDLYFKACSSEYGLIIKDVLQPFKDGSKFKEIINQGIRFIFIEIFYAFVNKNVYGFIYFSCIASYLLVIGLLIKDLIMVKQMTRKKASTSQQDGLTLNYNSYHTNEDFQGNDGTFKKPFEEK